MLPCQTSMLGSGLVVRPILYLGCHGFPCQRLCSAVLPPPCPTSLQPTEVEGLAISPDNNLLCVSSSSGSAYVHAPGPFPLGSSRLCVHSRGFWLRTLRYDRRRLMSCSLLLP